MRTVRQFQVLSMTIWALDDEGNLWRRGMPGTAEDEGWEFIPGPPDGEPGGPYDKEHWVDRLERQLRKKAEGE